MTSNDLRGTARWRTETGAPAPDRVSMADDRTRAAEAFGRIRRGEYLLYQGDYHNARQLLAALGRRLERSSTPRDAGLRSMADAFRAERRRRAQEHELLN